MALDNIPDEWDPLTNDYYDSNFNSYDTGAGANLPDNMQPANYKKNQTSGCKLWISPLSSRYTSSSLRNIFSTYGEVTDVFIFSPKENSGAPWAYVTYKTQASANNAIRAFNDRDKFEFKVKFAKEDSNRRFIYQNKDYNGRSNSNRNSDNCTQVVNDRSRNRPSSNFSNQKASSSSTSSITKLEKDIDQGYIMPHNCSYCKKKTFSLCSSCKISLCDVECSLNGWKLHVGSTCVKVSPVVRESQLEKNVNIEINNESRTTEAVSKEFANMCEDYINNKTNDDDENDNDLYVVQQNGYKDHNFIKPEKRNDEMNSRRNSNEGYDGESIGKNSRRSNQDNDYQNGVENRMGSRKSYQNSGDYQYNRENIGKNSVKSNSSANGYSRVDGHIRFKRNERQDNLHGDRKQSGTKAQNRIDRKFNEENGRKTGGSRNDFVSSISTPEKEVDVTLFINNRMKMEANKNVFVYITSLVSNSCCYVRLSQEDDTLKEMMNVLNEFEPFVPCILESNEDRKKCVARYKASWYRGLILNDEQSRCSLKNDGTFRIRFIDYGFCDNCPASDVKEIPAAFAEIAPFTYSVEFSNATEDELIKWKAEKQSIEIRPLVKKPKGPWVVEHIVQKSIKEQLEEVIEEVTKERSRAIRSPVKTEKKVVKPVTPEKIVDKTWTSNFKAGVPIIVYVAYIQNDVIYVVEESKIRSLVHEINNIDDKSLGVIENPKSGGLCMHKIDGLWCRGKIISVDPLKVYYIDYGNEAEIDDAQELKLMSTYFTRIPALVVEIILEDNLKPNPDLQDSIETITPMEKISKNPERWKASFGNKLASPAVQESVVTPKSGISSAGVKKPTVEHEKITIVVTYMDSKSECFGYDLSCETQFNNTVGSVKPLNPVRTPRKGLICACMYDNIWSRVEITDLNPLTVTYIDYGNAEICELTKLHEISKEYQYIPPQALKVRFLEEAESIYEFGNELEVFRDPVNNVCYFGKNKTVNDISTPNLENSIVNVVSKLGDSRYGVMLEEQREDFKHIMQLLNESVHLLDSPEKIRKNGKYLAQFDGCWCRAEVVILNPLKLYFLDFANTEICDPSDIKAISIDLMEIPPLAFIIETKSYVTLHEGTLVRISQAEKIADNVWKVVTNEVPGTSKNKRIETVADPSHIEIVRKKPKKSKFDHPTVTNRKENEVNVSSTSKISVPRVTLCDEHEAVKSTEDSPSRVIRERIKIPSRNKRMSISDYEVAILSDESIELKYIFSNDIDCIRKNSFSDKNERNRIERPPSLDVTPTVSALQENSNSHQKVFPTLPIQRHVNELLEIEDQCIFVAYYQSSVKEYAGMLLCCKHEDVIGILDQLEFLKSEEPYPAKRGDLIVTFLDAMNEWYRGYVLYEPTNVDPLYLVILLDIGIIFRTSVVYALPKHFYQVPLLSVRCEMKSTPKSNTEMIALEVLSMKNTAEKGYDFRHDLSIHKCEIVSKKDLILNAVLWPKNIKSSKFDCFQVEFSPWIPTKEEIGMKSVGLKDGDIVKIRAFPNTNECYVTPVNDDINEERSQLLDTIAEHCGKASKIDHEPRIKEIVGVPYTFSFSRAQIIEKKKEIYIGHLLDEGVKIKLLKEDMIMLPDNLKFVKCYAVRVQLKEVPRTDFNKEAEQLLKFLFLHEKECIVKIDDNSHCVELIFNEDINNEKEHIVIKKNSSYNKLLKEKLAPSWKLIKEFDFGSPLYYLKNLAYEDWEVGSELSLFFVESLDEKSGIMINRNGDTYAQLIEVNLVQRLREYAEELNYPHVPLKDELCIAKYDEDWYRAVCFFAEPGKEFGVQFIDIGYRKFVPHTDIRRMHSEFLKHPAAAIFCDIANYKDCENISALEEKVLHTCKVEEKIENGGYIIFVKDIARYIY